MCVIAGIFSHHGEGLDQSFLLWFKRPGMVDWMVQEPGWIDQQESCLVMPDCRFGSSA